jgi:hypothetical protein
MLDSPSIDVSVSCFGLYGPESNKCEIVILVPVEAKFSLGNSFYIIYARVYDCTSLFWPGVTGIAR